MCCQITAVELIIEIKQNIKSNKTKNMKSNNIYIYSIYILINQATLKKITSLLLKKLPYNSCFFSLSSIPSETSLIEAS